MIGHEPVLVFDTAFAPVILGDAVDPDQSAAHYGAEMPAGRFLEHLLPAAIRSLAFSQHPCRGTAHLYQGIGNVPRIVLAGIIFAALFLMTGSLWIPIVMHAAVDILQGRLGYEVMTRGQDGEPPADAEVSEDAAT